VGRARVPACRRHERDRGDDQADDRRGEEVGVGVRDERGDGADDPGDEGGGAPGAARAAEARGGDGRAARREQQLVDDEHRADGRHDHAQQVEPRLEVRPDARDREHHADRAEHERRAAHAHAGELAPADGAVVEAVGAHGSEVHDDEQHGQRHERAALGHEDPEEVAARGARVGRAAERDDEAADHERDRVAERERRERREHGLPARAGPAREVGGHGARVGEQRDDERDGRAEAQRAGARGGRRLEVRAAGARRDDRDGDRPEHEVEGSGDHADPGEGADAEQRDRDEQDPGDERRRRLVPAEGAVQRGSGEPGLEREPADDDRGEERRRHDVALRAERAHGHEREALAAAAGQVAERAHVEHEHERADRDGAHARPEAERVHDEAAEHRAREDHREAEPHGGDRRGAAARVRRHGLRLVLREDGAVGGIRGGRVGVARDRRGGGERHGFSWDRVAPAGDPAASYRNSPAARARFACVSGM
jgi:hypothetical protein